MAYHVKLSKVENGSALRTDAVEGFTNSLPAEGHSFVLVGEALDPDAAMRLIRTSPVCELVGSFGPVDGTPQMIMFKTENSTYRLDVLSDEDP